MRRLTIFWAAFALAMGFALGGTFVTINTPSHQVTAATEHHGPSEAAKSKKDETDEALAAYTLWLMVFTGVLAIATIGLGVATFGLYLTGEKQIKVVMRTGGRQFRAMLESNRITKLAADAARLSADAAVEAERGRLYPNVSHDSVSPAIQNAVTWNTHPTKGDFKITAGAISYWFKNLGKTPAFIHSVAHGMTLNESLPRERDYTHLIPLPIAYILDAGEKSESIEILGPRNLLVSDGWALKNGKTTLWVYGSIVYGDAFGQQFELDVVWHYGALSPDLEVYSLRERRLPTQPET